MLVTEPCGEGIEVLSQLHCLCDWVVTMDRNAGIEYFDSPREAEAVFEAYVIDAVPERDHLGCLQLITSTAHFDEVRHLLDATLTVMSLSSSTRDVACSDIERRVPGRLKNLPEFEALSLTDGQRQPVQVRLAAAPEMEFWQLA
ncbi:MAG: hypothetical protein HYY24_24050 [Verrucomicrobia bacterium]|nr:hypothetical protein [Verrucomicrobiota bacterium]